MTAVGSHNDPATAAAQPSRLAGMRPLRDASAALLVDVLTFTSYIRFESADPSRNRQRFYDLLWQPTLWGEGALVRVWGRRGRPGVARATVYADRRQAQPQVVQLVRRRLAHGYQVTDWL